MTESRWSVTSPDGTSIAVTSVGSGPPLVLVHGAAADHTTFRVLVPLLASRFTTHAIDRRGRPDSGDTTPYAIAREFEDVAAVAEAVSASGAGGGKPVAAFGHSFGGRCVLGAALLTPAIGRVISYEGAPTPPGERYGDHAVLDDLRRLAADGAWDALFEAFLRRVVGLGDADIAAYRANAVWPRRVAAAPTIVRELESEGDPNGDGSLAALSAVRQPVLQLLGGDSVAPFRIATDALDAALADGRVAVIPGARHAAHHTHPERVVELVGSFLSEA